MRLPRYRSIKYGYSWGVESCWDLLHVPTTQDVIERGAWCYSGYQQAKRWFGMLVIYSCRCIPTWLSSYSRSHFDETPSLRSAIDRRTVVEAVRCIARTRIKIPVLRLRGRSKTWERYRPGYWNQHAGQYYARCKYSTGRSSHPSC